MTHIRLARHTSGLHQARTRHASTRAATKAARCSETRASAGSRRPTIDMHTRRCHTTMPHDMIADRRGRQLARDRALTTPPSNRGHEACSDLGVSSKHFDRSVRARWSPRRVRGFYSVGQAQLGLRCTGRIKLGVLRECQPAMSDIAGGPVMLYCLNERGRGRETPVRVGEARSRERAAGRRGCSGRARRARVE